MGLWDDLKKRVSETADALTEKGQDKATEVATEASKRAAALAAERAAKEAAELAEKAMNEALDDVEKHLVGDLDEVNAAEAELNKRAVERKAANEASRKAFHQERMDRKDRAAAELAELKRKMGKS